MATQGHFLADVFSAHTAYIMTKKKKGGICPVAPICIKCPKLSQFSFASSTTEIEIFSSPLKDVSSVLAANGHTTPA